MDERTSTRSGVEGRSDQRVAELVAEAERLLPELRSFVARAESLVAELGEWAWAVEDEPGVDGWDAGEQRFAGTGAHDLERALAAVHIVATGVELGGILSDWYATECLERFGVAPGGALAVTR